MLELKTKSLSLLRLRPKRRGVDMAEAGVMVEAGVMAAGVVAGVAAGVVLGVVAGVVAA